jgi:PAS domain S-box-containing protein
MRKKLFLLIFSIIFITATVLSLLVGRFSYSFVKTVLRENREEKLYRIEKQLDHYQSILHSIEKNMDIDGTAALYNLAGSYPDYDSIKNLSPAELQKKAKKLNVGDIYFIDSAGVVFNTSLSADIGLNLLSISNHFTKYISSIYGKGEVISQGISVSTREGNINHYMYYSPKGSDIIYEVSFDVPDFVNRRYNFALYEFLFGDMFRNFYNEYLYSIDIYSISRSTGWSLINAGKQMNISPELAKRIIREDNVVVESGDKIFVYKKMKMNRYFFNRTTNVYFELIYDVSALNKYTKEILLYSFLSVMMITIAAFIITAGKLNSLFLKRITNIIDGLKMIRYGDYNTVIIDDSKDELSDIAASINRMTETIKLRSVELNLTNEELRELTLYVNDIIESMPSIIITLDENEKIIQWNREAEKYTGYSSGEAVGRNLWEFIPSLEKYKVKCNDVRRERVTIEILKEIFVKEDCGSEESFIKNIFIFPFSKKDITGVIIRIDDITELEKNEERLNRASRVEALGTMAGGLAHDFNNIISGIISTASYLNMIVKDGKADTRDIIDHLDIIKQSGGKAAQLVKNLLSVSRNEAETFSRVSLEQIVKDVTAIVRSSIPGNIELKFYNNSGESFIMGNRSELEQVILNLIVNASEAIKRSCTDNPVISILIEKLDSGSKIFSSFNGAALHLSVADNGPGIERSILRNIFDPFFTTKSEGSGLGLAVVHNVIIRHEGFIEVNSEPGSGTVFDIYLPEFIES